VGLARAYIAGELSVDSDLDRSLSRLADAVGRPHRRATLRRLVTDPALLVDAAVLWGPGLPPHRPGAEARLTGRRHSRGRDQQAIRHHYDLGEDFYRLLLGPSMTYSCAYWAPPATDLQRAQEAKHELVAAKLGLRPGHRLLDVGCGWGSFLIHAAVHHGVHGVGVTLSEDQARTASLRVQAAGVEDLVTIEHGDYRDLAGSGYDAIASIGMAEHIGSDQLDGYAHRLQQLLSPGGRLLHHAIASRQPEQGATTRRADTFITRYVFPDGQLQPLRVAVSALERAGLEIRDVQALREHYPPTLRAWRDNLRDHWPAATCLVGAERARVWELYLTASAIAFERDRIGVNQVLAVRPTDDGASGMPPGRPETRQPGG
jgi:cyclopropane-fatty-acyl-phospholipid synthase